jgi:purine-nucleoside phosphorylase
VKQLESAAEIIREMIGHREPPRVVLTLGSGLAALADSVLDAVRVPYADIPGFPATTTAGHSGELVFGLLESVPVVSQSGRFHLYEGYEPETVVLPVRLLADLGAEYLIVTNAAGGMNPVFVPPCLMLIADHINYMWRNPLIGPVAPGEHRWPDLNVAYDGDLRELAGEAALEAGVSLHEGVYAGVLGPSYETPAEIRMLRRLGADAVGMSTVPEVITARARGMRVLGISSITNSGAGLGEGELSHRGVLAAADRVCNELEMVLRGVVSRLPA